jgi:hypothetical protein
VRHVPRRYGYTVVSVDPESILAPFGATLAGATLDGGVHCTADFTPQ